MRRIQCPACGKWVEAKSPAKKFCDDRSCRYQRKKARVDRGDGCASKPGMAEGRELRRKIDREGGSINSSHLLHTPVDRLPQLLESILSGRTVLTP